MISEPHVSTRVRLGVLVIAVVAASVGLWPPGPAAAATAVTVRYSCPAGQSLPVQVAGHMPAGVVVGRPTPAVVVTAATTINAFDTALARAAGASSIDGSADAAVVVVAPGATIHTTVHLVMSPTRVPASGQMTVRAAGALPRLTFRRPGHAVVDIGSSLNVTATVRNASGKPIVNSAHVSCALGAGQHPELFSFDIKR